MTNQEITKKARELKRLKNKAEELQKQIKEAEAVLKAEMTARDVDELQAGDYKLRYKLIISNRFDQSAFKAECADLYSRYIRPSQCMRFAIS